ncbi:MAG: type II toxin-antitoxin system Phd/YefM family antitoxin [Pseudomonadota bacterium]
MSSKSLQSVNSTTAQNQFGKLLDDAQKEPILIRKNGRDCAVIVSVETYSSLTQRSTVDEQISQSLIRSKKQWDGLFRRLSKP